ncbi:hypothetical protein [Clostridium sp.]|uniref:hypothetical protein n=1 Tax=Clostridium sp. TaxID=1506 RepID=UPI003D6D4C40
MVISDLQIRVAQNCHRYRPRYNLGLINSISFGSESCNSCVHYVKEKCAQGLFDEIREIIRLN